jgi:ribonucleoside-diphosphate reductase beta chain
MEKDHKTPILSQLYVEIQQENQVNKVVLETNETSCIKFKTPPTTPRAEKEKKKSPKKINILDQSIPNVLDQSVLDQSVPKVLDEDKKTPKKTPVKVKTPTKTSNLGISRIKNDDQNFVEPLLKSDTTRFTLFPIKHSDIWQAYKTHESAAWTAEELNYSSDKQEWDSKLTLDEKYFIEHILAFFAGADGIVLENLATNFTNEVQWPEARAFYSFQGYIEQVHSQVYSTLIDTYITDNKRKDELFRAIETIPCVKRKADWAIKWMDPKNASFAERLVAFAVVEGVFFSGSFCAIFWLKSRGIMVSGLGKSNELIARDENLHCLFAILLYSYLENKLTRDRIHEIFKEAVEIETEFITQSIPCKLLGMNSTLMTKYIKFVANYWMTQLTTKSGHKCAKLYVTAKNPFDFMDMNGIDGKTNFFEQVTTEYTRSNNSHAQSSKSYNTFTSLDDNF